MDSIPKDSKYIILDCGSGYTKAGFSGYGEPSIIMPTVVGYPKTEEEGKIEDPTKLFYGQKALDNKKVLNLIYPIQRGRITDWDTLEYFLKNLFKNELKIDIKDYGITFHEKIPGSKEQRKKLSELFFEYFQIPKLYINNSYTLCTYGVHYYNGFVLDSGYDYTTIVPVDVGYPYTSCMRIVNVGGKDISNYLEKLLLKKGYDNLSYNDIENIKRKLCYVQLKNYEKKDKKNDKEIIKEFTYELPDKKIIKLDKECFLAPEILFHPEIIRKEYGGIENAFCHSIYQSDRETNSESNGTIILNGGNTLFPNFIERLTYEIKTEFGGEYKNRIKIPDIPDRENLQWIGTSTFSLCDIFDNLCTTKKEYEEEGPSAMDCRIFYH